MTEFGGDDAGRRLAVAGGGGKSKHAARRARYPSEGRRKLRGEGRDRILPLERGSELAGERSRRAIASGDQQAIGLELAAPAAIPVRDPYRADRAAPDDRLNYRAVMHLDPERPGALSGQRAGAYVDHADALDTRAGQRKHAS